MKAHRILLGLTVVVLLGLAGRSGAAPRQQPPDDYDNQSPLGTRWCGLAGFDPPPEPHVGLRPAAFQGPPQLSP